MKSALESVPGVRTVEVSFPAKMAVVIAKQPCDTKAMIDAVAGTGKYHARLKD